MSNQVWLLCHRKDVQRLKGWLAQNLSGDEKVRKSDLVAIDKASLPEGVDYQDLRYIKLPATSSTKQPASAIEQAIGKWVQSLPETLLEASSISILDLLSQCPKRWSVYRPMLLLPSGSFESKIWILLLPKLNPYQRGNLWQEILSCVSILAGEGSLTHLAINSGIPLHESSMDSQENVLRSPSGLVMLHGDFGAALHPEHTPVASDYDSAFWVSTKQNGIYQTWAPRYTMFSRGNIKEKSRMLNFHKPATRDARGPSSITKESIKLEESAAVDLYAGIGYFVFSYAAMGIPRIWCWEINPWSVEGLRRGAILNHWKVRVVKEEELLVSVGELDLKDDERIVVFEESNEEAGVRLQQLKSTRARKGLPFGDVRHVNCGFLPTSEPSWRVALGALVAGKDGWLHLHQNVAVANIETRRVGIEGIITSWLEQSESPARRAIVEHVEQVKTFAPGVWHCVFDVHVHPDTQEKL